MWKADKTRLHPTPEQKVPLYQQLQRFEDKSKARHFLLSKFLEDEVGPEVEVVTDLALSVSEQKALSAILTILDRTDYQGNPPPLKIVTKSHSTASLPRLIISHEDYSEAYEPNKVSERYASETREEALAALESLATKSRTVIYERKRWQGKGKNRKQVSDIIKVQAPLIDLTSLTVYRDLEEPEAERVRAGEKLPGKAGTTEVLIDFFPACYTVLMTLLESSESQGELGISKDKHWLSLDVGAESRKMLTVRLVDTSKVAEERRPSTPARV